MTNSHFINQQLWKNQLLKQIVKNVVLLSQGKINSRGSEMTAGSNTMSLVIRVFIGLLAAGLTPGIIAAILYFANSTQVDFIYSGVITVFIISLLHVVTLGVPAFLVGWYYNRIRPWSILFISFIIGALPTAVALRVLMPDNLNARAG